MSDLQHYIRARKAVSDDFAACFMLSEIDIPCR